MIASVIHILPLTTIRRERVLPVPGKVVVRKGQKVSATDTVAEANLSPAHLLVDVSRGLGLPPAQADKYIQVKAGAQIAEGDVLAGPVGLTRRVVRSQRSGRVVLAGSGQVLIEIQSRPFELKAAIPGIVLDLVPDRGAIIEATGALIQGVWGNGGIDYGLMNVLVKDPEDTITANRLDVSMRGSMVLAGHVASADVLKTAAEMPLRGLIVSSLEPSLVSLAAKIPVPVMIIDGFGHRPMDSAAFKLLTTNERREIALNAEPWNPYQGTRPEIVIPLPAAGQPSLPRETEVFAAGQQVRVVRAPYAGMIGELQDLVGSSVFPSGVRGLAGEVRLDDGEVAVLPLANLEVLE